VRLKKRMKVRILKLGGGKVGPDRAKTSPFERLKRKAVRHKTGETPGRERKSRGLSEHSEKSCKRALKSAQTDTFRKEGTKS